MLKIDGSEFKLKYEPDAEIDSTTLVETLIGTTTIIQEANRLLDPSRHVNVRVKALGEGSFEVHLSLSEQAIIDAIRNIFSRESMEHLAAFVAVLTFILGLRKKTRQNIETTLAAHGDSLTITCADGTELTIARNVYEMVINNVVIINAADKTLDALSQNKALTQFQVIGADERPLFAIDRTELDSLIPVSEVRSVDNQPRIVSRQATVGIVKLSFDRRLKWDVLYMGQRVPVAVKDADFLDRVERSEELFRSGDMLECELTVGEEYSPNDAAYIGKQFEISKVLQHIPQSVAIQLTIEQAD